MYEIYFVTCKHLAMNNILYNPDMLEIPRRPRVYRNRPIQLADTFTDDEIRDRYRFNRDSIYAIANFVREDLERPTRRNHAMSVEEQTCIGLRFLACGSFQQVIGDISGRDKSTVCRVIQNFCEAIVKRRREFVKMPDEEGKQINKQLYFDMGGFPSVIGCIDGTHVKVDNVPSETERDFVNRKGWHSINVQVISDAQYRFTDAVVNWPGSTHDSFIFRFSKVKRKLDTNNLEIKDGLILGDSGYPLTRYLMTPYQDPVSGEEHRYNKAHKCVRSSVERAIGQLKRRFPSLKYGLRVTPRKACLVISTCIVLHNIAKEIGDDDFDPENENVDCDEMPENCNPRHNDAAIAVRNHIASSFFGQ